MKIYAKFPFMAHYTVHLWTQHISEQIKETAKLMYEEACVDKLEELTFPFFMQEDSHAKWIRLVDGRQEYIMTVMYDLLFLWEREDFEEEDADISDGEPCYFDKMLAELGLNESDIEIPKEYVYLGQYQYGQQEPLTLPGLICDSELQNDGEVLADCMFKYIDLYLDVMANGKHVGLPVSLPYDEATELLNLYEEARATIMKETPKVDWFETFDAWLKNKSPVLYAKAINVWKQTTEEQLDKEHHESRKRAMWFNGLVTDKDGDRISISAENSLIIAPHIYPAN